jgi:hypothetical protein
MNTSENLNLKNLVKEYKYESTTEKIRELKHSKKIRADVTQILHLQKKYARLDAKQKRNIIEKQCNFLYKNYTNIFNKVMKGDMDMNLLHRFLLILHQIEEGKCDQHEASVKVGQILKEIYIDSAVREANRLDGRKGAKKDKKASVKKPKKISWNEFKKMEH